MSKKLINDVNYFIIHIYKMPVKPKAKVWYVTIKDKKVYVTNWINFKSSSIRSTKTEIQVIESWINKNHRNSNYVDKLENLPNFREEYYNVISKIRNKKIEDIIKGE